MIIDVAYVNAIESRFDMYLIVKIPLASFDFMYIYKYAYLYIA